MARPYGVWVTHVPLCMHREDGGVWKEPQEEDNRVRDNAVSLTAVSHAGRAQAATAMLPQEPPPSQLAFDLDEELASLEAQTKVPL